MKKNEEVVISPKDYDFNNLTKTMKQEKNTPNQFNFQTELFIDKPKQKIQHSECYECGGNEPAAGYRFRLVRICEGCRIEREVEITGNRFERRGARR